MIRSRHFCFGWHPFVGIRSVVRWVARSILRSFILSVCCLLGLIAFWSVVVMMALLLPNPLASVRAPCRRSLFIGIHLMGFLCACFCVCFHLDVSVMSCSGRYRPVDSPVSAVCPSSSPYLLLLIRRILRVLLLTSCGLVTNASCFFFFAFCFGW